MRPLPLPPPLHWLLRHVLLVLLLTVVVSVALVVVFNQSPGPTLVYCFFISLFCATCINLLRFGLGFDSTPRPTPGTLHPCRPHRAWSEFRSDRV